MYKPTPCARTYLYTKRTIRNIKPRHVVEGTIYTFVPPAFDDIVNHVHIDASKMVVDAAMTKTVSSIIHLITSHI
jgi:hypothetical protein